MRKIALIAFTVLISFQILAQVPSYVPTNGLVGYWPFNGNANDESGNGNNGAVNGASLTIDRFGNTNAAFDFDGIDDYINVLFTNQLHGQTGTINTWIKTSNTFSSQKLIFGQSNGRPQLVAASQGINGNQNSNSAGIHWKSTNGQYPNAQSISSVDNGFWLMITAFYTTDTFKIYINSILETSIPTSLIQDNCSQFDFQIGGFNTTLGCGNSVGYSQMFNGKIDDIGIWNRALTQQEITALYNSSGKNLAISPTNNTNRLLIYPNPAKDHITIDYGVFGRMSGYTLKVVNTLGQIVFSTPINQQTSYINLSTWTGKGMYYVQIYDASNTLTENRKIVLQ